MPPPPYKISGTAINRVFGSMRRRTTARLRRRMADAVESQRALEEQLRRVRRLLLEIIDSDERLVGHTTEVVRISTGLLDAVFSAAARVVPPGRRDAFRERQLGLIFARQLALAAGFADGPEADAECIRVLEASDLATIDGLLGKLAVTHAEAGVLVDLLVSASDPASGADARRPTTGRSDPASRKARIDAMLEAARTGG